MIAETVRAFFAEQATSERTRAAMAIDGCDHDLWRAFSTELGLAGVTLPEAFGGVPVERPEIQDLEDQEVGAPGQHVGHPERTSATQEREAVLLGIDHRRCAPIVGRLHEHATTVA